MSTDGRRGRNSPDDEVDNVHPHSGIRNESNLLQASNESSEHSHNHDDNHHGYEANARMSDLLNVQSLAEDQDGHGEELLERLGDVDEMAHPHAEEAQEWITKALHRVARGVEIEESLPDNPATPAREQAKDEVESYTGAVAHAGKDKPRLTDQS
jgi:hypothetical protein